MRYCPKCNQWTKPKTSTESKRDDIVRTTVKCGNCGAKLFVYEQLKEECDE